MKKAIKILSIIVIAVFIITPVLSNLYASVVIKGYYNLIETDDSVKLKTIIFLNIPNLLNAIFNIFVCIYLIKHSCEGGRYIAEIVILSVRVIVLPLLATVYTWLLTLYMNHIGTEAYKYLTIYSSLNNSLSFIQSIASPLLIIAFAFSISEKVHNKKLNSNDVTEKSEFRGDFQ